MTATVESVEVITRAAKVRKFLRHVARWALYLVLFFAVLFAAWSSKAIYHRFVTFPRQQATWLQLRKEYKPVPPVGSWHEYRGVLHSHSHFSHDSEVSFEEILQVLKSTGIDFICMSDHCVNGRADFDWQWRGLHEGKLFIPGFEMKDGIMPFGARPGTVLSNQMDSATLAKQVVEQGGVLFYAHPEEPRDWDRPELTGMEIYNIHTDLKLHRHPFFSLVPEFLLNQRRFPEQVFRSIFTRPTQFLHHWDELNKTRHITGIAGNDCHQNTGFRVIYTPSDQLRIEDTSGKKSTNLKLNWLTRLLTRCVFGPLIPNRLLWHVQLDPYERVARFVNTHVLATELTEPAILDALRAGRVFIGFDLIADSSGFRWWANTDEASPAVMGESGVLSAKTVLHAASPLPCRFTLVQDGRTVHKVEGRSMNWVPTTLGKYRVEAELNVCGEWVPWVYTNPIELR